ncbi:Lnb N-terminal periplasmic domain-containing protein [Pontibacter sp. MBLB2868]|uniref:Lnb N-terminal periplasmic domain-containing protein n=1 Tax=Pontibacter sp. MBLB2868 TaxID=3451555 RepID=UPI003F74B5FA
MKKYFKTLLFTFVLCFYALQGQAQFEGYQLSPAAKISLITCSSGNDLYAVFGHSAVRVQDPASGMDIIFNYGTFDFNEPNFYLKFARGKLNYKLSVAYFSDFLYSYTMDNRSVYEQVLNLTPEQRQKYWNFLTNNYLPENRFYLYDFFFDNCATRIRDGLEATFPNNQIKFNISQFDKDYTFRNLIDLYLPPQPWGDFGIDLALGAKIDREATPYEYMFLPDYLSKGFANATIEQNGQSVPLTNLPQAVYLQDTSRLPETPLFTPFLLCWVLLVLVLAFTAYDFMNRRRSRGLDFTLFLVTGFLGLMFLLLWFATDHQATANNYNLMWGIPTHLIAAFYIGRREMPKWMGTYLLITAIIAALLVVAWPWWPQEFNMAFLPIVLSLGVRAAYNVWFLRKVEVTVTKAKVKETI